MTEFLCSDCDYKTMRKNIFMKHLNFKKHKSQNIFFDTENGNINNSNHKIMMCNKIARKKCQNEQSQKI